MNVKRKLWERAPLETLFHQGPFQRQLIQTNSQGLARAERSRCCPLVDESVTAQV